MFLCTHRHSNLIIFLALQQTQALLFHDDLPVGWGGVITFMFLCTHMHSKLIIFLAFQQSHLHLSGDGVGRGGVITFMFLCTHRHSNLIMFLALQQTQALLFHDDLPVGWGGVITFMFLCTHGHSTLSSFLLSSRHRHYSFMMTYRWGGVGWGNNVHVPVHAHAQQAYHLSFQQSHLHLSGDGVGRGGVITFMFLCTHRHTQAQQPDHVSCSPADTGTTLS